MMSASLLKERQDFRSVHDLTQLEEITLDNVLDCLIERYSSSLYYTFAGPMLLSVNPCLHGSGKSLNDLNELRQFEDGEAINISSPQCPHTYTIADNCLRNLLTVGNSQMIIVSGDTGAGKTTVVQQLLRYFISKNEKSRQVHTPNGLERKVFPTFPVSGFQRRLNTGIKERADIYFATVILESMGNASTTTNLNSSRFGRLVRLNYQAENASIVGANIHTCLLEKHRVSKCSLNERNFHIFYYILSGLEKGTLLISDFVESSELRETIKDPKALVHPDLYNNMRLSDAEDFSWLHHALRSLKILDEFLRVFRIIFGIAVLLNVQFSEELDSEDGEKEISDDDTYKEFVVKNKLMLEIASDALGLNPADLGDIFIARRIVAGGNRRKSIFRKPCSSITECEERLASFTSNLYDVTFGFLVSRLNSMLCGSHQPNQIDLSFSRDELRLEPRKTLSLLDLYGFESLERNHLEQLCINYANERLHQIYLLNMKSLKDDLMGKCIPLQLEKIENESQERLTVLQSILFRTLNEECILNRSSSDFEIFDRLLTEAQNQKYLMLDKLYKAGGLFIVRHYASDVSYQLEGLARKNLDYVPPEFSDLCKSSTSISMKSLFSTTSQSSSSEVLTQERTPQTRRDKTVLQRFKTSVDSLMNDLNCLDDKEIHFIKCVRPADNLNSRKVQRQVVQKQLFSCGIVDAIKIAGNGYPIRVSKAKFQETFHGIFQRFCKTKEIDEMIRVFSIAPADLVLGEFRIFMTECSWQFFAKLEGLVRFYSAQKVQKAYREMKERRHQQKLIAEIAFSLASIKAKKLQKQSALEQDLEKLNFKPEIGPEASDMGTGPGGDAGSGNPLMCLGSKMSRNTSKVSLRHVQPFDTAIHNLLPVLEKLNLGVQPHLVTKSQIYHGPISFFTRKPALRFAQVTPKYLQSQGILELFRSL